MTRRPFPLFVALVCLAAACSSDSTTTAATTTSESPAVVTTTVITTTTSVPPTTSTASTTTLAEEFLEGDAGAAAEIARVAGTDEDGPFYMVNLLDFADEASYDEGSEWAGSTGLEANARYSEVSGPAIAAVGGVPVFVGTVERSLIPGEIAWDMIAIVRYPSRQAVLDLNSNAEFVAATEHKDASLEHTFALMTDRIELPVLPPADPATVPFPATDDDPPFMMVHIIDFHEVAQYQPGEEPDDAPIGGRDAVERYSANAGSVAAPLGVRSEGWFAVVDTLLGEHGDWEEVRLNSFPSGATFQALTSDPTWAEGTFHRNAGIAETYALMTSPIVFDPTFADG